MPEKTDPINAGEELQQFLLETLREGKDFVTAEAPLVVHDYLWWGVWGNLVYFFLFALLTGVGLFAASLLWKRHVAAVDSELKRMVEGGGRYYRFYDGGWAFGAYLTVIISVVVLVGSFYSTALQSIKAANAPRAYLIDKIRR